MKHLLIIVLLSVSTVATAQSSSSRLKTQIVDDNKTLSIQIDGNKNGRKIHYSETFNVANMNRVQKDVLKYRAFASQDVALPIHEMTRLITMVLGAITLMITLLIVGLKAKGIGVRA